MTSHPSPFGDKTITEIQKHLPPQLYPLVLDPFAGIGGIHKLKQETIGVEIEPEWASQHPDTVVGNALFLPFEDDAFPAVATSPTFGNRMADSHNAKDASVRNTYKHKLGRDLHDQSSGGMQWGEEYREFHVKTWREVTRVVSPGGRFILHMKNHVRKGKIQPVAEWHMSTIISMGWTLHTMDVVPARGLRYGANFDARTDHEFIMVFDQ